MGKEKAILLLESNLLKTYLHIAISSAHPFYIFG